MIYTIFLVEELIFSSHQKSISPECGDAIRDVNVSLFKWISLDYLCYYMGSNERSLWAEWDLLENIFNIIENIYPEWMHKHD